MDLTNSTFSRRAALAGAGGVAGAALAAGGLPAWARPLAAHTGSGVRRPGSRPFPNRRAGEPDPGLAQIEHIVVLMMENHSFDNMLGAAALEFPERRHSDGLRFHGRRALNWNPDANGKRVYATPAPAPCQGNSIGQDWNRSHRCWDGGRNDGFVRECGEQAMWYWDRSQLPVTYSLIEHFPYGERYFCSVLAQTFANRRYLFCGTSSGLLSSQPEQTFGIKAANGTIFDRLNAHGISWLNYTQDIEGSSIFGTPEIVPSFYGTYADIRRVRPISQFYTDAARGQLPQFTFLDPNYGTTSEENPQDIQFGEQLIWQVVRALMHSPQWEHTALFINYDEHGGYYDHVSPPRAIKPDNIAPIAPLDYGPLQPGGFDRYGFRVPLIVVSPWAKRDYISRIVQDHTSVTALIERKWNLPAMTYRDANAHPMTDYFDFTKPAFREPPALAAAPSLSAGEALCRRAGIPIVM